jgi:hypothetical protein
MIINCSLHDYNRICLLHLGTFFYSFISFLSSRLVQVGVSTILNILFLPVISYWFTMQVCNHVHIHVRLLYLTLIWENINNDTLNTSGWNAAAIVFAINFDLFSVINLNNSYNKKFVLKHIILYIHCVDLLMWSPTKLNFLFYDFFVIYYDFSKILTK